MGDLECWRAVVRSGADRSVPCERVAVSCAVAGCGAAGEACPLGGFSGAGPGGWFGWVGAEVVLEPAEAAQQGRLLGVA